MGFLKGRGGCTLGINGPTGPNSIKDSFYCGLSTPVENHGQTPADGSGAETVICHVLKSTIPTEHAFCGVSDSKSIKGFTNDHSYCKKDGPKNSQKNCITGTVCNARNLKTAKNFEINEHHIATSQTAAVSTRSYCANCQTPILGIINDHTYCKNVLPQMILQNSVCNTVGSVSGQLKIFSLNVGGLKSKLVSEDLEQEISNYDIICLSEVKMDSCDVGVLKSDFEHFTIFTNIEEEYTTKPRGGIIIFVKNYLCDSVQFLSKCKLLVSIEINGKILRGGESIVLSAIYIPPAGTAYSRDDDFDTVEQFIHDWQVANRKIILTGDFNAKTNNHCDYLTLNAHDAFENLEGVFDQSFVKLERKNQDQHELDLFGQKLLNLCKISNLQIVNGRLGRDGGFGKFTTTNNSVIDYTVASPELFSEIEDFQILEFNRFMSDVHNPMTFSLISNTSEPKSSSLKQKVTKTKWDGTKNDAYLNNIDESEVEELLSLLEKFKPSPNSNETEIEFFLQKTNNILESAKTKTFPPKTIFVSNVKKRSWYDKELTLAKNKFHSARKQKNREKIRSNSKRYKSLLTSKFQNFLAKRRLKLKQTKTKNPRIYWEMIKGRSKGRNTENVSVDEFGTFFKNLNSQEEEDTSDMNVEPHQKDPFDELNAHFTENELKKALKNLKNNKSTGADEILNEQIKNSFPKMKNVFLKLFNIILETGCFPEEWAVGLIVPIFKNKGSKNDPNNYRGITLLSCMAKFFNSVLNNRLKAVGEKILSVIQAGFRPGFSTMDHAFTLLCIFALYERLQKNLFIAFIDYQKAFDTVWRAGLWLKLINEGVSGKFLNVIKDMYAKSKSCVLVNNQKSESFGSYAGVRQGEILSPLLFALYINDLEGFLRGKGISSLGGLLSTSGEVADFKESDILLFMDVLTLFYADDTIIFADTALGLQFALEELENYCQKWKLTVNEGKTKIMCITWGRHKNQKYDFFYNNQKLECVDDFIYLGICFTKKGLTNTTISNRETASKKAMFSFMTKCKQNHLPIEVQLDVFQKTVVPCMLYGGELWGFNKADCLEIIQKKFLKYSLKLKMSTPTVMLYLETGYFPIESEISIKIITFWVNLLTGRKDKLSYKIYRICLLLFNRGLIIFKWMDNVLQILNANGYSSIFRDQLLLDDKYLKNTFLPKVKTTIRDQARQVLLGKLNEGDSFYYYKDLITFHGLQNYLYKMPADIWIPLIKFRTSNHKLPVELQSWKVLYKPREERYCSICNLGEVGDEFHYISKCPIFSEDRQKYIPSILQDNTKENFINILTSEDIRILRGLAKFLNILFGVFE